MELSSQDFAVIRDLLYERTGMMFEDKKISFLESRISRRATAIGCSSPRDYYRLLRYSDPNQIEFQSLVEQVTTNETYFFRDYPQLECFANEALPLLADAKRKADNKTLNIWSACCSTGDEAYTLAIILQACLDDFPDWRIRIYATDIDTAVLNTAKIGRYGERNVKDVAAQYLQEYFIRIPGGYRVKETTRKLVTFDQLNLADKSAMRHQRNYDFVFCRNALIYFDDVSRRQVLGHFFDALVPGGFVFLGHSESVGRISAAFDPVLMGGCVVYRKPSTPRTGGGSQR